MAYIVKKIIKKKKYYYAVKGKKNKEGKVEQIWFYIGDKDKLIKFHEKIKKHL